MKILISAAETSSDAHGAFLLRALKELEPCVEAFGVGGPKLQAAGLKTVVDARELLVMGFLEVFGRLPKIFGALNQMEQASLTEKPDVAVVIDYPDFHFRLAKRLRAQGVPVIYYIPPKVWVWRKRRIRVLKKSFAKVLSILPFEVEFYEREGVPVKYVGNPLVDALPLSLTRARARADLGLSDQQKILTVMTGSRPAEINQHLDLMLDGATRAAAMLRSRGFLGGHERLVVLLPFPVTSQLESVREKVESWLRCAGGLPDGGGNQGFILDVRVSQGDAPQCLVAADAGLIKSGTSTLEAAILGCPHAIVYRPNRVTEWIFKYLIRYRGPVGLSNLVAGWSEGRPFLVRELLCSDATVEAISNEIVTLFTDPVRRAELQAGLRTVRTRISGNSPNTRELGVQVEGPSVIAAREVIEVARQFHRGDS